MLKKDLNIEKGKFISSSPENFPSMLSNLAIRISNEVNEFRFKEENIVFLLIGIKPKCTSDENSISMGAANISAEESLKALKLILKTIEEKGDKYIGFNR